MNAEIIAVGTEILMGQIVNSNATDIARTLNQLNIPVYFQSVVGDNPKRLKETLALAKSRSQLVILSGGLGPTEDDLTKQTLSDFLDEPLIYDRVAQEKIEAFFEASHRTMTLNNRRQALTFQNGISLSNSVGLAVGSVIVKEGVTYVVLPGPPRELRAMLQEEVIPYLAKRQTQEFHSVLLRFTGIGESLLATEIDDLIQAQTNPTIAIYAKTSQVDVRLTANGASKADCLSAIEPVAQEIISRLSDYYYGVDQDTVAGALLNSLKERKLTLSLAESLTGGMAQSLLVDVPGASQAFEGGVVSYSNAAKHKLLGISEELLKTHGAISQAGAIAMAVGVKDLLGTDVGLSFTGIADKQAIEGKPAGTAFVAIAYRDERPIVFELSLQRDRQANRLTAALKGLQETRKYIEEVHVSGQEKGN